MPKVRKMLSLSPKLRVSGWTRSTQMQNHLSYLCPPLLAGVRPPSKDIWKEQCLDMKLWGKLCIICIAL